MGRQCYRKLYRRHRYRKDPHIIKTPAELAFFARSVNEGNRYENMYITLAADIRLNDEKFTFDADTGLVKVTDGEHTAYFGTGVEGREGGNAYFDQTPSVKGAWYESDNSDTKTIYGGTLHEWTPIGDYKRSYDNRFRGHFDGNCHTVSGIYINSGNTMIGLFGYAFNAQIEEIQIDNSLSCGGIYTGSVAGYGNARFNGVTRRCINNGIVIGINCVGGIVGNNTSLFTEDCYHAGSVEGNRNAGGIGGYASSVKTCYSVGSIKGNEIKGGYHWLRSCGACRGVLLLSIRKRSCGNGNRQMCCRIQRVYSGHQRGSHEIGGNLRRLYL